MARLTFAGSPTGSATCATQTKFENLTGIYGKICMDRGLLNSVPDYTARTIFSMPNKSTFVVQVVGRDTGFFKITVGDAVDAVDTADIAKSSLPASGDVILYFHRFTGAGGRGSELFKPDGTSLGSITNGVGSDLATGASSGNWTLHNVAQAADYDGMAIYSAVPPSKFGVPTSADANLVALYFMATGADEVGGGTSFTTSNATFDGTAGAWDSAAATPRRVYYSL